MTEDEVEIVDGTDNGRPIIRKISKMQFKKDLEAGIIEEALEVEKWVNDPKTGQSLPVIRHYFKATGKKKWKG